MDVSTSWRGDQKYVIYHVYARVQVLFSPVHSPLPTMFARKKACDGCRWSKKACVYDKNQNRCRGCFTNNTQCTFATGWRRPGQQQPPQSQTSDSHRNETVLSLPPLQVFEQQVRDVFYQDPKQVLSRLKDDA
ncbi:hypothetical protein BC835DRAFT_495939 [Cytidiella melzeri]|nr:hypothetical protein BC835DRAFT_495939 [Cytidiella melzeri]